MHPVQRRDQKMIDENPFVDLKISDTSVLDSVDDRILCKICKKSRKYFCYICYIPMPQLEGKIPQVNLPIKIDIIKHKNEIDGKSTSAHAAILAPNDVRVFTYPFVPTYDSNEQVVVVYPSQNAKTIKECFNENSKFVKSGVFPFTRAVFIDSTWNQSKGIYKDERISSLPAVILKNKVSQFWRHQKNSPRWYLATVEAIHELLVEMVEEKNLYFKNFQNMDPLSDTIMGNSTYNGEFDNLLFFFSYMYSKIHKLYDHEKLYAYKRPL